MTRPNLENEIDLIHKVCHYLNLASKDDPCEKCPYRIEVRGMKNCAPGCILEAEELINIVRTGDTLVLTEYMAGKRLSFSLVSDQTNEIEDIFKGSMKANF